MKLASIILLALLWILIALGVFVLITDLTGCAPAKPVTAALPALPKHPVGTHWFCIEDKDSHRMICQCDKENFHEMLDAKTGAVNAACETKTR